MKLKPLAFGSLLLLSVGFQSCKDDTQVSPKLVFQGEINWSKALGGSGEDELRKAFGRNDLHLFTDAASLSDYLLQQDWNNRNLLLMSSGNFGGLDIDKIKNSILH